MHEQEVPKQQQITEPPVVIKTTGLSPEAKQMFDMIAHRAYEIFEARGKGWGRELENWLEAESELFEPARINVKESADGLTVLADVRGFEPKELEVDLEPKRVTIIGKHSSQDARKREAAGYSEARSTRFLRSLQLPIEIDTHHASARYRKGILELDMRRAAGTPSGARKSNPDAHLS